MAGLVTGTAVKKGINLKALKAMRLEQADHTIVYNRLYRAASFKCLVIRLILSDNDAGGWLRLSRAEVAGRNLISILQHASSPGATVVWKYGSKYCSTLPP